MLPFANVAVSVSINGAELKTILENGVSTMPAGNGRFPQVSGLCFTYDISAAAGSRVLSAVRQAPNGSCTGAAVSFSAGVSYVLVENDFMAGGGDGYPNLTGRTTALRRQDDLVSAYLSAAALIAPAIQGRIVCTTSGATSCPVQN